MILIAIALGILLLLYLLFFLENRRFKTTFTSCQLGAVKTQFRVVQVSDLHDQAFGKDQIRLIYEIQKANPDLIVITGDLFNRHDRSACKNAFAFVKRAVPIASVYFIEGNHECSLKETGERYIQEIAQMGVCVLRDSFVDLDQCRLIGLTQNAPAEKLSSMLNEHRFNLVLAHRPERFPIYGDTGADVILSGHAHGGQIRIGRHGIYAPQQGLFPKYTEGWYRSGKSRMYVSRGLGNTIAFPRIFNTPELNVIDFISTHGKGE